MRRPFLNPGEDRRPTLTFPRNIPLDGEPNDTYVEINKNFNFVINCGGYVDHVNIKKTLTRYYWF